MLPSRRSPTRPAATAEPGATSASTPTSAPTPAPRVLLLRPAKARPDAARQLAAVVAGLQAGGAEVTQLTPGGPGGPDDQQARNEPAGRRGSPDRPARQGLDLAGRCRSAWETATHARALGPLDSVVVGQVDLALTGLVTARLTGASRVPVLFHGVDMWTMRRHLRLLLRHDPLLCPVTTSSFGAGALSPTRMGAVIPPGLDHRWREALLTEAARRRPLPPVPTVLTVFPLDEWEAKGLPTLVGALDTLHAPVPAEAPDDAGGTAGPVRLVIAGAGPAPGSLHALIAGREHTDLFEDPSDEELARLYATADLFALCTRTRTRSPVSGESHPTALLEAQLAGCAVIGPAQGGSRDAYQRGVTGWTPTDESSPALARVLADLLADRARLARAGRLASDWARAVTDPDDHSQAVFAALLGRQRS